jgi:hypothetical protein
VNFKVHNILIWKIIHIAGSCILGLGMIVAGAYLAERYNLPFFHSWALAHGTFFILYPIYCVLFFLLSGPILRRVASTSYRVKAEPRLLSGSVLSVVLSSIGFLIPPLAVAGVIIGHIVRRRYKNDFNLKGAGVAMIGLIVRYGSIAFWLFAVVIVLWAVKKYGG